MKQKFLIGLLVAGWLTATLELFLCYGFFCEERRMWDTWDRDQYHAAIYGYSAAKINMPHDKFLTNITKYFHQEEYLEQVRKLPPLPAQGQK